MKYLKFFLVIVMLTFLVCLIINNNYKEDISLEEELLEQMNLEEKIGQMFIVRCPKEEQIESISEYKLGGYILFSSDFEGFSKEDVKNKIASFQEAASIPMFIGVDEEGGSVVRISKYKELRDEAFKSAQELYALGGFDMIYQDTVDKANFLLDLGINVNFAPVADMASPGDYIYNRTFGGNVSDTSTYVKTVVTAMNESHIGSVLKHFPGYGSNSDTHVDSSVDERSYEYLRNNDMIPFEEGIKAGASMVMVSHNIVESIDSVPSSLSLKIHNILRDDLGYDGVIITDDLDMDAISKYSMEENVAVTAIKAGNDIICITDFKEAIPAVIKAVEEGSISEEDINNAVLRILKLKNKLGLLA